MLAIIGGTSLTASSLFTGWEILSCETPYGEARIRTDGRHFFVQRHGTPPLPPHRINHRAHIWALGKMNVNQVVAVNSVGSLKPGLRPASFVVPHDFISLWDVPTFFDEEMRFTIPGMDDELREYLGARCREAGMDVALGGVYIQTRGPRLETRAEIELLRNYGDIVGMTMASEATLCREAGIPYASLCSVDNYCNGIVEVPLTMDRIAKNVAKGLQTIEALLSGLLERDGAC